MISKVSQLPAMINRLPIIGNLSCHLGKISFSLLCPAILWLCGYRRISCGVSSFWAPQRLRKAILDGIECLRNRDKEMFERFTKQQRLFIYYGYNTKTTNLYGYVYAMHQSYLNEGAEWIACYIIQSLYMSEASPSVNRFRLTESENYALKNALRKTMERMREHSFSSELLNSYGKLVEMWEQKEVFRSLAPK
jgi:hypothetical protein